MKNVFRRWIIGLILLSSTHVFAVSADRATGENSPVNTVLTADTSGQPTGVTGYDPDKAIRAFGDLEKALPEKLGTAAQANLKKLTQNLADYKTNQDKCKTREDKANTFCIESRNPSLKTFIMAAQVIIAGVSGLSNACSKMGEISSLANDALTAYQAACSSWRGVCMSACGDALKNVKDAESNVTALEKQLPTLAKTLDASTPGSSVYSTAATTYVNGAKAAKEEFLDIELQKKSEDYKSVADKASTCDGYAMELASAAVGIVGVAKSFATSNNCKNQTTTTPTPIPTATPVDCTIAANKANNMTCICADAPRTPGCDNTLDKASNNNQMQQMRAGSGSSYDPTAAKGSKTLDTNLGGNDPGLTAANKSGDSGGGLPGAPSGGGSPLGADGGMGSGAGAGGSADKKAAGLNTNILGGEGGGGGGGGGWGGSSEGGGSGLRQYMPGGQKDPAAMAGAAASKEVTSQGGKSNWEKVKDRYRDNKPTLLGY